MKKIFAIIGLCALLFTDVIGVGAQKGYDESGKYAEVNGVKLYYTVSGSGPAILLLHGNGEDHTIFDTVTAELEKDFTVYAVDSRCHGKSTETDTISYDDMAEDFTQFINTVIGEPTIVYGFSDGGIISLLMAIDGRANMKMLISSGANTHPKGVVWYSYLASKVAYFFNHDAKTKMMLEEPNITAEDLKRISIPSVILAGQFDIIKRSDTEFIAKNIKNSVLRIIPMSTHGGYVVNSEKLYPILKDYIY